MKQPILLILLVAFLSATTPVFAQISINTTSIGQPITISTTFSGQQCGNDSPLSISKVTVSARGGNPDSTLDLSSATINITHNGQPLSGPTSYHSPLPAVSQVSSSTSFTYQSTDSVTITVAGVKARRADSSAISAHLEQTDGNQCARLDNYPGYTFTPAVTLQPTTPQPTAKPPEPTPPANETPSSTPKLEVIADSTQLGTPKPKPLTNPTTDFFSGILLFFRNLFGLN